jgi:hypothetical protein
MIILRFEDTLAADCILFAGQWASASQVGQVRWTSSGMIEKALRGMRGHQVKRKQSWIKSEIYKPSTTKRQTSKKSAFKSCTGLHER